MFDTPSLIMAVWILSMLGMLFVVKIMRKKFARKNAPVPSGQLKEMMSHLQEKLNGVRCWECGERYVGLALDCRCTNWGK